MPNKKKCSKRVKTNIQRPSEHSINQDQVRIEKVESFSLYRVNNFFVKQKCNLSHLGHFYSGQNIRHSVSHLGIFEGISAQ